MRTEVYVASFVHFQVYARVHIAPLRPALRELGCGAQRCGTFPPRELVRQFVLRLVPRDPVLRVTIAPAAGAVPAPQYLRKSCGSYVAFVSLSA